jgi:hypothetical protein
MPDFKELDKLFGLQPGNAAETPKCYLCGAAEAPDVAHGTFPDGSQAGFVPVCKACYEAHKAPPEDEES